jgi:hypothetical protein
MSERTSEEASEHTSEDVVHEVRDAPALAASDEPRRDAAALARATLEVEQAELVRSRDELAIDRDKLAQARQALDREHAELAARREALDKEHAEFEKLAAAAPAAMRRGGTLAPLPSASTTAHSLGQLAREAQRTGSRTALVRYLRARRG